MDRETAMKIMEAILFVSDTPVPLEDLHKVLEGFNRDDLRTMVADINAMYENHALQVVEIAEGYQVRTRPEFGDWVKKFHKISRSTKLSQAALESLSIIAYRQPITRQEVEDIRGVDCSGVIKNLLDKGLVKVLGRKKVLGKPVTFGTTKKFLEYFGLVKLTDLPTLKDLPGDEAAVMQEALQFGEQAGLSADGHEMDGETGDGSGEDAELGEGSAESYDSIDDFDEDERESGKAAAEYDEITEGNEEGTAGEEDELASDEGDDGKDTAPKNTR